MFDLLAAFGTSLVLGMRHATDADHVVAVTTIVSRERSLARAGSIGALWGLGHTLTLFAVGGAIIGLRLTLTPRVGLALEFAVALMLVGLGLLNLFDVRLHRHRLADARPLLVGAVHGLAGSAAAVLLVLPLIEDVRWAVLYLLVFGLGTMVGMALVTIALAAPATLAARRMQSMERGLRLTSGALSVAVGLWLAHALVAGDGLFSAAPRWTPG
jgi:high-affinity nickel-transport protein